MSEAAKIKYLSTTALAKELNIPIKKLFEVFSTNGFIERENDNWILTEKGKKKGGMVRTHPKLGSYIVWAWGDQDVNYSDEDEETKMLGATALSNHFGICRFRVNPILSEQGLIQKSNNGWIITKLGKGLGGKQFENKISGAPYVCWDKSILSHKPLLDTIKVMEGNDTKEEEKQDSKFNQSFREKFVANHRAADGHYVRSRAEMLIDNWLYMCEIAHAYERKLPIEENVYCDFYLPAGKVYIEYWGLENDVKYLDRKKTKLAIYKKYGFNLIELNDDAILNLDDILPKKLLEFGIQVY